MHQVADQMYNDLEGTFAIGLLIEWLGRNKEILVARFSVLGTE
jgi:hypothetical protein